MKYLKLKLIKTGMRKTGGWTSRWRHALGWGKGVYGVDCSWKEGALGH